MSAKVTVRNLASRVTHVPDHNFKPSHADLFSNVMSSEIYAALPEAQKKHIFYFVQDVSISPTEPYYIAHSPEVGSEDVNGQAEYGCGDTVGLAVKMPRERLLVSPPSAEKQVVQARSLKKRRP